MNQSSLIGHVLELCELTDLSSDASDKIVASFFHKRKYLGAKDRRFILESVYIFIRNRRFIDILLKRFANENINSSELDTTHIRYLPLYVASSLVVENTNTKIDLSTINTYWKTYFPNIDIEQYISWMNDNKELKFLYHDKIKYLAVRYSTSDWFVQELIKQYGEETEKLLETFNTSAQTILRVNQLKTNREECMRRLNDEGIKAVPTSISPVGLVALNRFNCNTSQAFKEGWYEIQDEGSQLVSILTSPKPGDFIIDACAGAGGKTLHLANLIQDKGRILSLDVNEYKLKALSKRAERAGVKSITTKLQKEIKSKELNNSADVILVDAPCSGTGRLRRSPETKLRITEDNVNYYASLQLNILQEYFQYVKVGGKLVYVTCSVLESENEKIIETFLSNNQNYVLAASSDKLFYSICKPNDRYIKLLPHIHHTDGFFIAIMNRIS